MNSLKSAIRKIPLVGPLAAAVWYRLRGRTLRTHEYWETRYASGGTSGAGSYGRLARYKADFLNAFVQMHSIQSVIEFGCGDGNQLRLAKYPTYVGTDVSRTAIEGCRRLFAHDLTKRFVHSTEYTGTQAEVALSLDVIYHLIEEEIFDEYMRALFAAATTFVVIYSSNKAIPYSPGSHERHREFTAWVSREQPRWMLKEHIKNPYPYESHRDDATLLSHSDFFVFARA